MSSRIKKLLKEKGVVGLAKKVLTRLFQRLIYERVDVLYLSIEKPPAPETNTLEIYSCDFAEFQQWAETHKRMRFALDVAEQRFKDGATCYIGKMDDGRLGHVLWTNKCDKLAATYETGEKCHVKLDSEVGTVMDAWTPTYARGRNYYPQVMRFAMRELIAKYSIIWIWVLTDNIPSIRGIKKVGYRSQFIMGRTRYLGFIETCHHNDSPKI